MKTAQKIRSPAAVRASRLAAVVTTMVAITAQAHHSYAMFDKDKRTTLEAVVTEYTWINPHVFLEVDVLKPASGAAQHLSLECASVGLLKKEGWTRNIFKRGDKVAVTYLPLRDGRAGGLMEWVTLADGRKLSNGNPPIGVGDIN